jgi:hypothetical protein
MSSQMDYSNSPDCSGNKIVFSLKTALIAAKAGNTYTENAQNIRS